MAALRHLATRFRGVPEATLEDAVSAATVQLLSRPPPDHVDLAPGLVTACDSRLRDALKHEHLVRRKHEELPPRSPSLPIGSPDDGSAADPIHTVAKLELMRHARRIVETDPRIPGASRATLLALLDSRTYADIAGERSLMPECVRKQAERGAAALLGILDLQEGRG